MRYYLLLASVVFLTTFAGCDNTPDADPDPVDNAAETPVDAATDESDDTVTDAPESPTGEALVGEDIAPAQDGAVTLDGENTKITFVGTKPDGKHEGGFKAVAGTLKFDPAAKEVTSVDLQINTPSLWSDDEKLTNHLKSPDFFNVREHPTASYTAENVEVVDGQTILKGELTLLGTTKPVEIPVVVDFKDGFVTLKGDFELSRKEFGMTYGADKIDDTVAVTVAVDSTEQ